MNVTVVLLFDRRPDSVGYDRYFENVGGKSVLRRCVEHLTEAGYPQPVVLAFSSAVEARARKELASAAVPVRLAGSTLQMDALASYSAEQQSEHVVAIQLECLLAMEGGLATLIDTHLSSGNDLTWIESVPLATSPLAFRREALERLSGMGVAELAGNCWTAADLLRRSDASQLAALQLRLGTSPPNAGAADPALASLRVSIEYPDDVQRLFRVLDFPTRTGSRLKSWHRATTRDVAHRREELARRAHLRNRNNQRAVARVLYVSHSAGYSGAEESLIQLLAKLPVDRIEKHALVSLEGVLTSQLRKVGVQVTCAKTEFSVANVENFLLAVSVLREVQPDLVHLNGLDGPPIVAAAQLLNIPIVVHVRNGVFTIYEEYARSATRMITVSHFLKRGLEMLAPEKDPIEVIYDEVDPEYFRPCVYAREEARAVLGLPRRGFVAACIARFAPNKRHDLLLAAVSRARERVPDLHLLLKGEVFEDAPVFHAVQEYIERSGLRDRVSWIPFVEDIRTVHCAADVLVLCSDREGLGRCVVEAMSMEVPVIATRGGGTEEIVQHGVTGLLVEPGNAPDLARALETMARDGGFRAQLGRAARRYAVEHLSSDESAAKVLQLYREVLQSKDSRLLESRDARAPIPAGAH